MNIIVFKIFGKQFFQSFWKNWKAVIKLNKY